MKVTVVPAQVTTVEDRIIGNLGFSQLLLLVLPVFVDGLLFALLPPAMGSSAYKYITLGIVALCCATLAIRIKGKILAVWLVTILRYNLRPTYYIYNKNVPALRVDYAPQQETREVAATSMAAVRHVPSPRLDIPDIARVLAAIENPAMKLQFETTKKGGLNVRLTEIEE